MSPSIVEVSFRIARRYLSLLAVIVIASSIQWSSAQATQLSMAGTVRSESGDPVADASVLLEEKGSLRSVVECQTGKDGTFRLAVPRTGTYVLRATKKGFRDTIHDPIKILSGDEKHLDLVILAIKSGGKTSPADGISFEDKPDFVVAGITDWTAVGGHGADTNLRASETLARETLNLKADGKNKTLDSKAFLQDEAQLKAALARDHGNFKLNHELGELYLKSGRNVEALFFLDAAEKINPNDYSNKYDLASALEGTGDLTRARQKLEAMEGRNHSAELRRKLGDIDERLNDSLAAVKEYELAAKSDPSEDNFFYWGAELLLHRAIPAAIEVFEQGNKIRASSRMLAGLGAALYASGSYEQASQEVCAASDLNPSDRSLYIFLGQMDQAAPVPLPCAKEKLERFAQAQPGDASANYFCAVAIYKSQSKTPNRESIQQSESLLKKAITINPKFAEAYLQLGNLYSDQQRKEDAIAAYDKATETDPSLAEAHYRLAVAYQRSGNELQAQQEFKRHDEAKKSEAEAVERQRREIRQFLIILNGKPAAASNR